MNNQDNIDCKNDVDCQDNIDVQEHKTINIVGTNNRYMMKKVIREKKAEPKKREASKEWTFSDEYFNYNKQMKMINDISANILDDNVIKIIIQQINKKISSYKQQDILKKILDTEQFIDFNCVINKMIECELKCRYCLREMNVLYDISREMSQWSVDRVDNNLGHNIGNFHLACLDCNLKRRRRTDEKFLFTKQLNIIKQDTQDTQDIKDI
jgi:hypothetical protein